ncbi:hypothetical protein E3N88_32481 [Mikania micrantha]|uniref:Uncharacterized protein n=1 Tax=Mikania micrantha TaxID=192012 RepID=A0A5N6M9V8_9ASTR|nr:hypothetical protein E3N88_32481 [Mikania micrantha]
MTNNEQQNKYQTYIKGGKTKAGTVIPARKKHVSTRMGEYVVDSLSKTIKNAKNKAKINPKKLIVIARLKEMANNGQQNNYQTYMKGGKAKAATVIPAKKEHVSTKVGKYVVDSISKAAKNAKNKTKINPENSDL